MPSAANAKSEKPASAEATDNSPIRQIMTIIEHKIRNLEKRKSKLTSYRDLQKAGKELNSDQKVAVAKYDEVAGTLEFARDLSKQVASIATVTEREAKKQAKKEAWVRYAADTGKIREVLLILDCLVQMGNSEARDDFLNATNGACKLTEEDLKILDDLYPEVTPKHEVNEDGQPGFHIHTTKAAEHLYAIIDGKPKDILGTTYTHIKEIITAVHECGYFDKGEENAAGEGEVEEVGAVAGLGEEEAADVAGGEEVPVGVFPAPLPVAPAPAGLPAPGYPLRPLPPITLQEVEHAYFAQQYPQQRPIAEVIGSQNFFFLQESELDSPAGTPQPPPPGQSSPPAPIPTQTFTNQHFVRVPDPGALPLPPHFPPPPHAHALPEHAAFVPHPASLPLAHAGTLPAALPDYPGLPAHAAAPATAATPAPVLVPAPAPAPAPAPVPAPALPVVEPQPARSDDRKPHTPADDEWKENRSPEQDDGSDRKTQGQGDGQGRFRRYGRGGRGASNGFRGRGAFQSRQGNDYHGRHGGEYQGRAGKDGYQGRTYNDNYQGRHGKDNYQSRGGNDAYYGNGDAAEGGAENGRERERDRYDGARDYAGGFKGRGRGGPRPARGAGSGAPAASRPPRTHHYTRKADNVE